MLCLKYRLYNVTASRFSAFFITWTQKYNTNVSKVRALFCSCECAENELNKKWQHVTFMETDIVAEICLDDYVAGFCTFLTVIFLRDRWHILYLTTYIQQCGVLSIKAYSLLYTIWNPFTKVIYCLQYIGSIH